MSEPSLGRGVANALARREPTTAIVAARRLNRRDWGGSSSAPSPLLTAAYRAVALAVPLLNVPRVRLNKHHAISVRFPARVDLYTGRRIQQSHARGESVAGSPMQHRA